MLGMTGILKNEIVAKYFTKEDLIFIEKQYISEDSLWKENKKGYKVLDSLKISEISKRALKTHKMKYYYHSLSNPLFSLDGKYMIIIIDFYCGFMCSHQCIYLFQKSSAKNKSWKKIEEWSCLSA